MAAKKQTALRHIAGYGWAPDLPDHRDLLYAAPPHVAKALPAKVDLRSKCPKVYDQGQLGSCTANSIAGAIEFDQMKQGSPKPPFTSSRLFIYYNERAMEGTVSSDSGAQIRDGIKSCANLGTCPEEMWPYDIAKFAEKPPAPCYTTAAQHLVKLYSRVPRVLNSMKGCLADGYPFVFGFTVYESFEGEAVAKTGIVPLPQPKEAVVGGHAVMAVGYIDAEQMFLVRNSWGPKWGLKGYFKLPYAYLTDADLSDDFWTIRLTI